ncbi:MAG: hypothetical protein IPJ61_09330 [Tessaracoccus sp.]|uniref:hypothetical protein n=1 Tax=Tessaracoccus sp. TaxID=1971211 RepID=UPI001ED5E709|nr:hypothetical protein [Tessaracoccus sp.]MBK7821264.1 hypothetical protein [Tessaracoccus sp.]
MPRLREIYIYPYAGWWGRPWTTMPEPWDDVTLDRDAAARSARRVTESVSQALRSLAVEAPRGQLMLDLMVGEGDGVELEFTERFLDPSDRGTGRVRVPMGFRNLSPTERARQLGEVVVEAALRRAELHDWDVAAVEEALCAVADGGFRAYAAGPWKVTRDRKRQVRLCGEIADDGFLRMWAEIDDAATGGGSRRSEEIVGWTWLENVARAAKKMRLTGSSMLTFGAGSNDYEFHAVVDLDTGAVTRTPPNPVVLSYPGA